MQKNNLKKLNIPKNPGVYFFRKGREVLYVGKATSLRSRVRSYFGDNLIETRGPKLVDMIFLSRTLDWKTTDSVLEALILEANLIKKYQPKYNTLGKSDTSFNYVVITREKLPRILIIRGKNLADQKGDFYGPFTQSSQLREAMKIIRKIFPYLDDKSENYYTFYKQVGLAPDISTPEGAEQYKRNIRNIKLFFSGKKKKILKSLEREMKAKAKVLKFEEADEAKRQIFALKHINDVALLKEENINLEENIAFRIEAYDIAHMAGRNMVGVMVVALGGIPTKGEYRKFRIRTQKDTNDTGALVEVLERRLTHQEWPYPDLVVLDGGKAQINAAKKTLERAGMKIPVVSVLKDERHKPKDILGEMKYKHQYEREILLANSEAHRFAIAYHKKMRGRNFLK